jgi:cyanate permease
LLLSWLPQGLSAHSLLALLAGVVVLDLAAQLLHVSNQNLIYALQPEARNRLNAGYMTGYFIGGSLGSLLSAQVYQRFGWTGVCVAGTAVAVLALLVWLPSAWRARQAASAD